MGSGSNRPLLHAGCLRMQSASGAEVPAPHTFCCMHMPLQVQGLDRQVGLPSRALLPRTLAPSALLACCHCRCEYVTNNEACHAEDHYLSYLPSYYCAGGGHLKWLMMLLYLGWMLVLFYALSEVAEGFLVPAVEVRLA